MEIDYDIYLGSPPPKKRYTLYCTRGYCCWTQLPNPNEDYWETKCGNVHIFITGTPKENKYKYCPYCARPIKIVKRR